MARSRLAAVRRAARILEVVSFADRHRPKSDLPPRVITEEAPEAVRRYLLDLLEDDDELDAHGELCSYLDRVPDDLWGKERYDAAAWVVKKLEWFDVYELIERHAGGMYAEERIEKLFSENGIAYQYVGGEIIAWEPDAEELEVAGIEDLPLQTRDPDGRFAAPKAQYAKALDFLRRRPADLENAVASAVNAVEGAVTVITGEKTLSVGLKKLHAGERTPLRLSIEQLHNFGSAMPGVRHGAHALSDLNEHEARHVVRAAGSALAYLIAADHDGIFLP